MIDLTRRTRALASARLAGLQRRRPTSSHPFWTRGRLRAGLALGALALTLLVGAPAAYAATISVTTTTDELNVDGDCSLREAIQAANTDTSVDACPAGLGPDVIDVPAGTYTLAIAGSGEEANQTGDLDILRDLTITGAGTGSTILDGGALDRVLDVDHSASFVPISVQLKDLTIRNGAQGGIRASRNNHALTLTRVTVTGNTTTPFFGGGGGVVTAGDGTLTVESSSITGNSAPEAGAGIQSHDRLVVVDSLISGNVITTTRESSASGGAGINHQGLLTILRSSITDNRGGFLGGGIFYRPDANPGTITDSTISGNSTNTAGRGFGGGLDLPWSGCCLTITNSTISGNTALNEGGGIRASTSVSFNNSTVTGNSAPIGGGISTSGSLTLRNTIVANSPSGGNCSGPIVDGGGNMQYPGTDCGATITSADPLLGPLAANDGPAPDPPDGPTKTHALLPGSPAIDAAVGCPPPTTDQRGVPRPQGGGCDIGAFELEAGPGPPAHLALEPTADTNEVRTQHCVTATVTDANGKPVPDVTVRFSVSGANTAGGSATTDENGRATFCYTGTVAGPDAIRAFADTDGDGFEDPDEPFGVAAKLWICPPGVDDLDNDGLDDRSEDLFGNLINDVDSDDDGILDGNDDGDDDGEDDEDEDDDDGTDRCPEDGDGDGEDDEDEDDEEDDD